MNVGKIEINFDEIENMTDFYSQLRRKVSLPKYFGNNLDALYDTISGELELPISIKFINIQSHHLKGFHPLLKTMEDLGQEEGIEFTLSLKRKPDFK